MDSHRLGGRLLPMMPIAAWLAVIAVGAWLLAGWLWLLGAPPVFVAPPAPLVEPAAAAAAVAERHWFGGTSAASTAESGSGRFRLFGAMTGHDGRPGMAVIGEDGKSALPVIEGEEFAPGVRLQRVLPRAVELRRQGRDERLELNDLPAAGGKS